MNTLTDEEKTALRESAAADRQTADAKEAFANGKQVQYHYADWHKDRWADNPNPKWSLDCFYRPKPEPRKRLWNCKADVPMPGTAVVRSITDKGREFLIIGRNDSGFTAATYGLVAWDGCHLFEVCLTGKPDDWRACEVEELA